MIPFKPQDERGDSWMPSKVGVLAVTVEVGFSLSDSASTRPSGAMRVMRVSVLSRNASIC